MTISNVGSAKAKRPLTLTDTLPDHVTLRELHAHQRLGLHVRRTDVVTCHDGDDPAPGRRLGGRRLGDDHDRGHV